MNRFKKSLVPPLCFICLGCAGLFGSAPPSGAPSEPRIINVIAKRYQFDPQIITVNQGEHVRLNITALDRDHGIQIKDYDINKKLKKGVPATIEFTADKAGTFPFRCSVWCGLGHGRMKGQLIVRPAH